MKNQQNELLMNEDHLETRLLHDDSCISDDSSLVPPIIYSATFRAKDAGHFSEMASQARHPRYYTRYGNPIHERVSRLIAGLEGGESGLVTSSGMGALSSTILGLLSAGDHLVAQSNHYMATTKIVSEFLPRFGVETTIVDQVDLRAFEAAIRPNTKMILVETPANPTLGITELAGISKLAKAKGILTICDNTLASPVNQNPISFGIDVVVHSATKFLGGHHDLTAGAIVGRKYLVDKIWETTMILGPTLSPMDAWLLLRGLRTLALRVERQNESALSLASFLEDQPDIESVFYPGLKTHPQHALAQEQMRGFGGVFAIAVKGGYQEAKRFISALRIPTHAVSLGGVESLVVHAAAMW
jgi:methionine-gamma-lyase